MSDIEFFLLACSPHLEEYQIQLLLKDIEERKNEQMDQQFKAIKIDDKR